MNIKYLQDYVDFRFEVIGIKSMVKWTILLVGLLVIIGFFSGMSEVLLLSIILSITLILFNILTNNNSKDKKMMTYLFKGVSINILSIILLILGYLCIIADSHFNLELLIILLIVYLLYNFALFYSAIKRITNGYYSTYSKIDNQGKESVWPLIFAGAGYMIAAILLRDIGADTAFLILGLCIIFIDILLCIGNTGILRYYYYSKYKLQ